MSSLKLNLPNNSIKFSPLCKFSKKTLKFVEDDWHHAVLSHYGLFPTEDDTYNSFDFNDEEIIEIIKKYGIKPPSYFTFWNRTQLSSATDEELLKKINSQN